MPLRLYAIGSGNGDGYVVSGSCEIRDVSMIINSAILDLNRHRGAAWIDGGVHLHLNEIEPTS